MKRILFVDDEREVLNALRDAMQRHSTRWETHFASSARLAIQWMSEKPFDVVITDHQMPDIDGVGLLSHVKARHPSTVRVIVSDEASGNEVLGAASVAQQFLSKPCEPETLLVTIERACHVSYLLSNNSIRDIIGRIDQLPSPPRLYRELTAAAARPEVALEDIAAIIEQDPAMSLKILQLVSSAHFGPGRRPHSLLHAISRLGIEQLKALALSVHAFGGLSSVPFPGFSIDMLQRHAYVTARLAAELAPNPGAAPEAFTAGLLHDIGKLVIAVAMPEVLSQVLREHRRSRRPHYAIEQDSLGVTHAEVGAYLLATWGLPLTLVEAVAYHHRPSALGENAVGTLAAVHIADGLIDPEPYVTGDDARHGKLDRGLLDQAALARRLPQWRERVARLQASWA